MVRKILSNLNSEEIQYYPFIISMSRCIVNCNTVEDPFGRICVSNEIEYVNLKVFNIVKGINESNTLAKYILCECVFGLGSRNVTRDKNEITASVSVNVKNQWQIANKEKIMPGILVHVLASVTSESAAINPSNRTDYWLVAIILLVIACLLLLMAIAAMDCYLINKATKSTIQYNILQPSE